MNAIKSWIIALLLAGMASLASGAPAASHGFAASFVQTRTLPGFDAPLVSHGMLRFSADGGFRWEVTAPYHYVFEMHGGVAREVLPDGTHRVLDAAQTPWLEAVQHIFVSALSGDRAELERYFDVRVQALVQGRQVTLTPKPGAMARVIRRIEVTELAPGQPQHLVIDEESGGRMDVRFTPLPAGAGSV